MALAPVKSSNLAPSCQCMGPTEISGQEALGTRNPLSTATAQLGQKRWIRSSREGACWSVPTFGQVRGEGGLSVCVSRVGVWPGEVEVGSYIYFTSSSSFQKPSKKPGDSVGVRVKKDETLGINHHQFTGGDRKCERQIFTDSPGPGSYLDCKSRVPHSSPCSGTDLLCGLGLITSPFYALVSSSVEWG